ncbi:MAG: hypothetical protein IKW74_08220, partial [Thermoguttaceae bacterium]|nr:hypothetical protein [Thermoguttaceae bacterium]
MKQSLTLSLLAAFLLATSGVFAEVDQEKSQTIQKSTDEAYLIQTLENIGDSEDDIYYGNIACKRLAVYGTDAAIPTLVKMLASEKQNFNARFALEAMPGDAVNPVLEKAAQELSGYCLVGVIDTLGVRKDANAVAIFKDILASNKDVKVTKAIYAALGSIANDDAIAILLEEAKTIADRAPITVNKYDENTLLAAGLADAILDCADACEIAGNTDKAIELFDAVINPAFPVFNQKAGSYRGLLARDAAAVELLISKMKSEKCCCFVSGLKSIREYSDNASESIVKALVDVLPELSEDRQVLVIRALGDRCDEVSQKLTFPVLDKAITSGSNAVKIAAMRALVHVANVDIKRAAQLCADFAET